MSKKPMNYYISDFHFNHTNARGGIIGFERFTKFSTIEEHDKYLVNLLSSWAEKWVSGSTLWFLGDFGNPNYMWIFNLFRAQDIEVKFIRGNHDNDEHRLQMAKHVDEFYEYPQFVSHKLILSHHPQNVWRDQLSIHGHLHSAILDSPNHINANIHVHNYTPVTDKEIQSHFSKLPKYSRKWLQEPYSDKYKFTQKKEEAIYDSDGRIDLSATRMLQKMLKEKENSS